MSQNPQPSIRPYRDSDLALLFSLYSSAVRAVGPLHYTGEQIRVWTEVFGTQTEFAAWLSKSDLIVTIDQTDTPIAFAGLENHSRIASLYVAPEFMRRGVATNMLKTLIDRAESNGAKRLTTEASEFSRPLFEKQGFEVVEVETVDLKGVPIDRYKMVRD